MSFINRLPHEPYSMWRAMQLGGPEHIGWSVNTYKLADLMDAIQINTVISAHVGSKKAPELPEPVYRPEIKTDNMTEDVSVPTRSLEEFDISKIMPIEG
jgi:hypothetical protein